ncbi:unnamed protein product [Arctogadus glacialis]
MDIEAMKCQVLTVSNHSCESLSVVGNTVECTVPQLLQGPARPKELQVECPAPQPRRPHGNGRVRSSIEQQVTPGPPGVSRRPGQTL